MMNSLRRASPAENGCRQMVLYRVQPARLKRWEVQRLKPSSLQTNYGFAGAGHLETISDVHDHCAGKSEVHRNKEVDSAPDNLPDDDDEDRFRSEEKASELALESLKRASPAENGCRQMVLYRVQPARRKRLEVQRLKPSSLQTNYGFAGAGHLETISDVHDHCAGKSEVHRNKEVDSAADHLPDDDDEERFCSEEKASELALERKSSNNPSSSWGRSSGNDVISSKRRCFPRSSSHGSISVIGRRREMEDAVTVELGFVTRDRREYDFFGVYDGHRGSRVAHACRDRLHWLVAKEIEEGEDDALAVEVAVDWEKVMVACFGKMDEEVLEEEEECKSSTSLTCNTTTIGSTAVVAVVGEEDIVVANCGDSRAVMSRRGVAVSMSNDHKPDRPDELERIEDAGGRVINWNGNRILGVLATSRSIGDHYLKPFVIPKPEVKVIKRSNADEFLILATDGLWDVISNEVACQVVRRCLDIGSIMKRKRRRRRLRALVVKGNGNGNGNGSSNCNEEISRASEAAAVLVELAMARGSKDNISVVVVELNRIESNKTGTPTRTRTGTGR